jgi:hypothetical protein
VGVAPLGLVAGVAPPAVRDSDAPGEPDGFVGDEHLAVGAVVELTGAEPVQRPEPVKACSRVLDRAQHLLVHRVGTPRVQQDADPHAVRRARGQAAPQLVADLAGPVDERQEVDRVLSGVDGLEHRREDLVTVAEDVDAVAFGGGDAEHALQGPPDAGSVAGLGVGARHPLSLHAMRA